MGNVLLQQYNNGLYPMEYLSKKYIPVERNYAPLNKELLEIFRACKKYKYYIDGHLTTVVTNYKLLLNLQT